MNEPATPDNLLEGDVLQTMSGVSFRVVNKVFPKRKSFTTEVGSHMQSFCISGHRIVGRKWKNLTREEKDLLENSGGPIQYFAVLLDDWIDLETFKPATFPDGAYRLDPSTIPVYVPNPARSYVVVIKGNTSNVSQLTSDWKKAEVVHHYRRVYASSEYKVALGVEYLLNHVVGFQKYRAEQRTLVRWGQLTSSERAKILKAKHDGKGITVDGGTMIANDWNFLNDSIYEIVE
jgi:hypothetical protein